MKISPFGAEIATDILDCARVRALAWVPGCVVAPLLGLGVVTWEREVDVQATSREHNNGSNEWRRRRHRPRPW